MLVRAEKRIKVERRRSMATNGKLSKAEFVRIAILRLRTNKSKGVHTVFSGLNSAYRVYFEGDDPVKDINAMVKTGKFEMHPTKGGVMLYIKGEMPKGISTSPDKVLGTLNAILAK